MRSISKLIISSILVLNLAACSSTTKNFQPGVIPPAPPVTQSKTSQTKALLEEYAEQNDLKLYQSGPDYQRVKKMVKRLSKAAGLTGPDFPVYIADAGDVKNAFAINSNTIVVYKALLDALPKDEELAVIMAHEVSHILGQHSEDDTERNRGTAVALGSILLGTAASIATGVDAVGDTVANTANTIGAGAFVLSYGRAQEFEADHIGLLLMAKAGYDPKNAISVWENADKILGKGLKNSFLSSHPTYGNRKRQLQEAMLYAEPLYQENKNKY